MDTTALRAFHKKLHRWYAAHGRRELPWRNTPDPYRVYLSEVMLQQTQVKTVLERYYFPFLKRFPTLKALAAASEQDVMKAWEGLGYYSRARNLYKAAKTVKDVLPKTPQALMELPGIGRNTAHAVAAFAFKQKVPVMEANVKRVLCRIFALKQPAVEELWEKAAELLDPKNPFDYNQAMMDIGAMICTPRNPDCPACPANVICKGQADPEAYPARPEKKKTPVRIRRIVVLMNEKGQLFLTKRTSAFLGGLYGFIETETSISPEFAKQTIGGSILRHGWPYNLPSSNSSHSDLSKKKIVGSPQKIGAVTQTYSHFRLEAEVFVLRVKGSGKNWYTKKQAAALPLSRADLKVLALL